MRGEAVNGSPENRPDADAFQCAPVPVLLQEHRLAVDVPPKPEAVAQVRRHLAKELRSWGLGEASDALLVCSEFATNAIRYAPGPDIELTAAYGQGRLLITVADSSHVPPALKLTEDAIGGRGLALVYALTQHRGWTPLPHNGKCVWGELAVRHAALTTRIHHDEQPRNVTYRSAEQPRPHPRQPG